MISQKNVLTLAGVLTAFSVYGEAQSPAETFRKEAGVTVESTARQLTVAEKQKNLKKITQEELAKLLPTVDVSELPAVGTTVSLDGEEYLVVASEAPVEKEKVEEKTEEKVTLSDLASTKEAAPAVEEVAAPVTEEAAPVEEVAAPVTEEVAPAVEEVAAPATEEVAPVEEVAAPATEEAAPVKEEVKNNVDSIEPTYVEEDTTAEEATSSDEDQDATSNDQIAKEDAVNTDPATPAIVFEENTSSEK